MLLENLELIVSMSKKHGKAQKRYIIVTKTKPQTMSIWPSK